MKTIKLILALIIVSIIGCNKDDNPPANPLVGTWLFVSETYTNCPDPNDNDNYTCTTDCFKVVFKSDKTGTVENPNPGDNETFTYTISGRNLSICLTGNGCNPGSFSTNGSTLNLVSTDPDTGCKDTMVFQKQ